MSPNPTATVEKNSMIPEQFRAPETPPPLNERVKLSGKQQQAAESLLTDFSVALEGLPVFLSQQGTIEVSAGAQPTEVFERMARQVERLWRDGTDQPAREVIRFDEEVISSEKDRTSFLLYSVHVAGALTLTVGWQPALSLTQLRAETGDAVGALRRVIAAS
jgi:hypothetical protein